MARSLVCLLILLIAGAQAAVYEEDPEGDVAEGLGTTSFELPAIDILRVDGTIDNGTLHLHMNLAGRLPTEGQATANQSVEYAYLFIVGVGASPETNLLSHLSADGEGLLVRCAFHEGIADLECTITQGNGRIRSIGLAGHNLSAGIAIEWDGRFALGAAATKNVGPEGNMTVIAQDFTTNALPPNMQDGPDVAPAEAQPARPWYTTPWALLAVIVAGVGFGLWRRSRRAA